MIQITIKKGKNVEIIISGHAKYAPIGYDIVCSAISVLYQNLLISIEELTTSKVHVESSRNEQRATISALDLTANVLINSFKLGCKSVAEAYPKHVEVLDVRSHLEH